MFVNIRDELRADIKRYGDPRQTPGFDPERRLEELDQLRSRRVRFEQDDEAAEELELELRRLQELAADKKGAQSKKLRAGIIKLRNEYLKLYPDRNAISPKLAQWVSSYEAYRDAHRALFDIKPTNFDDINRRLEAIGEFSWEEEKSELSFSWNSPATLACDWTSLHLTLTSGKKREDLERVLNAWDRFAENFQRHEHAFRAEILDGFRRYYEPQIKDWERPDYTDENGEITDALILEHVESGVVYIFLEDSDVFITAAFGVDWDSEHGVQIDVESGAEKTESASLSTKPTEKEPEWLGFIRHGDVEAFVNWLNQGGSLDDTYAAYGAIFLRSVRDYIAGEGDIAFVRSLLERKVVNEKQLVQSLTERGARFSAFRRLLPLLDKSQWIHAFSFGELWSDSELLTKIEKAGLNLNAGVLEEGATPLHVAVMSNRPEGVRWLLERGADPEKVDTYRRTPMTWAENNRALECLQLLFDAGGTFQAVLYPGTIAQKLVFIKKRWPPDQFAELVRYLKSKKVDTGEF